MNEHNTNKIKRNEVFIMAGEVFNNSNFKSLSLLYRNVHKSKKSQVGFITASVEPQFPGEYEPFNVHFKFKNTGGTDSGEFTVKMLTEYLNNSSFGIDREDQAVSSLKPGEKGEVVLTFNHGMLAGNYVIEAYLDHFNQIKAQNDNVVCRHTSFDFKVG